MAAKSITYTSTVLQQVSMNQTTIMLMSLVQDASGKAIWNAFWNFCKSQASAASGI